MEKKDSTHFHARSSLVMRMKGSCFDTKDDNKKKDRQLFPPPQQTLKSDGDLP